MGLIFANGVEVLAEHACGLLALNKPEGVRAHPNTGRPDRGAIMALAYDADRECYTDAAGEPVLFLVNRIDAPTSGLMLAALSEPVAIAAREAFAGRSVAKTYYALVRGRPARSREQWHDRLQVRRCSGTVRVSTGSGDPAHCEARLVESGRGQPLISLLELRPTTGRTHQLRVQCASRNLPIVGDATYGDFRFNRAFATAHRVRRMFLHAGAVELSLRVGRNDVKFTASAPLPAEFRAALK